LKPVIPIAEAASFVRTLCLDCDLYAYGSNGGGEEALLLSEVWMLSEAQMRRIEPYFPLSHGIPRVDDRRIVNGIIFVISNGLLLRDAPAAYVPHETVYNRFIRWSHLGVFNRIFAELAAKGGKPDRFMTRPRVASLPASRQRSTARCLSRTTPPSTARATRSKTRMPWSSRSRA
jgi:transposase